MNHSNYTTSNNKMEIIKTSLLVLMLMIIATLTVIEFTHQEPPAWDVSYPMANANVSWLQTHYSGVMPND